jgi:putative peptidoglycan lipid II flippase
MGGLLWLTARLVPGQGPDTHGLAQTAALVALIVGGVALYGLLLSLLGVTGWREALKAVRRTPAGDLRA